MTRVKINLTTGDLRKAAAADGSFGPAMSRLTPLQQAFVIAAVQNPTTNAEELSRLAGYGGSNECLRVTGHVNMHNPKVLDAITEETEKRVRYGGLIGIAGLIKVAMDKDHPHHIKACNSLADRGGFSAVARQEIKVEHTDKTGAALVDKIKQLAVALGMEPMKLLGENSSATDAGIVNGEGAKVRPGRKMKLIEAQVVESVQHETSSDEK